MNKQQKLAKIEELERIILALKQEVLNERPCETTFKEKFNLRVAAAAQDKSIGSLSSPIIETWELRVAKIVLSLVVEGVPSQGFRTREEFHELLKKWAKELTP